LRPERCIGCGACTRACQRQAIVAHQGGLATLRQRCTLCGACGAACPAEARELAGRKVGLRQLLAEIDKDVAFFDASGGGVTFSGGEPLMQPDALLALLNACQERGIHTAVDTSGHADARTVARVADRADLFLYDLKHVGAEQHRALTGVGNELVLANLALLAARGAAVIVRIPVVPGANDDDDNIQRTGALLASLKRIPCVCLLPFHGAGLAKYARVGKTHRVDVCQAPSPSSLKRISERLAAFGLQVTVGG
jgi:pyruvate formate lyase activating enzyme